LPIVVRCLKNWIFYREQLDELRLALASSDGKRLEEVFGIARQARRNWAGES
jgi:prephenate dehydrogenase